MRKFCRNVEITDTGMVIAEVFDVKKEKRIGLKFFHFPWFSVEIRMIRAHVWCSKYIKAIELHHYDETEFEHAKEGSESNG